VAFSLVVGAVRFTLAGWVRGRLPAIPSQPFLLADGAEIRIADVDGESYLVVDYRQDPARPARIEFWRPDGAPEGRVAALVMLAEAALPGPAPAFTCLSAAAAHFGGGRLR